MGLAVCMGHAAAAPDVSTLPWVTVTRVSDGDTVWVKFDGAKPFKLRLQGIDAPERCQAGGAEATAALSARVLRQRVRVETRAKDDYQRTLGNLYLADGAGDGKDRVDGNARGDVSAWLVSQGHAWSYRSQRSGGPYAAQEREARAQQRGLFADPAAIEPRVFRHTHGPCER